ncbi:carotene hydroxylase [Candidatus Parcubacteria bacterium]|nr:MAG: carotene hydroxylase [Candidatus Parcubacteria bacterium]
MVIQNLIVFLAAFFFMEFMAWFMHKFIMHGVLWSLHRDHHKKDHSGFFEWNDVFFIVFAAPSIYLIYKGYNAGWADPRLWMGLGIAAYGMAYVFVHDLFVHQRFRVFRKIDNAYFRALRKAHRRHHKHLDKTPGENFGFLIVPWKYVQEAKSKRQYQQ